MTTTALIERRPPSAWLIAGPTALLILGSLITLIDGLKELETIGSILLGMSTFMLFMAFRRLLPAPSDPLVDIIIIGELERRIDKEVESQEENRLMLEANERKLLVLEERLKQEHEAAEAMRRNTEEILRTVLNKK